MARPAPGESTSGRCRVRTSRTRTIVVPGCSGVSPGRAALNFESSAAHCCQQTLAPGGRRNVRAFMSKPGLDRDVRTIALPTPSSISREAGGKRSGGTMSSPLLANQAPEAPTPSGDVAGNHRNDSASSRRAKIATDGAMRQRQRRPGHLRRDLRRRTAGRTGSPVTASNMRTMMSLNVRLTAKNAYGGVDYPARFAAKAGASRASGSQLRRSFRLPCGRPLRRRC